MTIGAAAVVASTAGAAAPAAIAGGVAGHTGCHIAKSQCKREVSVYLS